MTPPNSPCKAPRLSRTSFVQKVQDSSDSFCGSRMAWNYRPYPKSNRLDSPSSLTFSLQRILVAGMQLTADGHNASLYSRDRTCSNFAHFMRESSLDEEQAITVGLNFRIRSILDACSPITRACFPATSMFSSIEREFKRKKFDD